MILLPFQLLASVIIIALHSPLSLFYTSTPPMIDFSLASCRCSSSSTFITFWILNSPLWFYIPHHQIHLEPTLNISGSSILNAIKSKQKLQAETFGFRRRNWTPMVGYSSSSSLLLPLSSGLNAQPKDLFSSASFQSSLLISVTICASPPSLPLIFSYICNIIFLIHCLPLSP